MDYRNSGRNQRRRRDRVYCPPGKRLEERREQLRGYAGFSFDERKNDVSRYYERNERYKSDHDDRIGRYDSRDDRYDRDSGYHGHREAYDRFERMNERDDYNRRSRDRARDYFNDAEEPAYDLPEYNYPPFANVPGYPMQYPGMAYMPYNHYGRFMTEEEYKELLEFEEFEDYYGRDFDRYDDSNSTEKVKSESNTDFEKQDGILSESNAKNSQQPKQEEFSECDESVISFDDDFDDDFDDQINSLLSNRYTEEKIYEQNRKIEEPFFPEIAVNNTVGSRAHERHDDYEFDSFVRSAQIDGVSKKEDPSNRRTQNEFFEPPLMPVQQATTSITKYLVIATMVMCMLCGWMISSGHIIEETSVRKTQRMAAFDLQTGIDSISLNVVNEVLGLPKIYTLPLSETPANKPKESGFSSYVDDDGVKHDTYVDETISVDVSRSKYTVGKYTVIANVARVKIAHPTQLRSAFAGGGFGSTRTKLSKLAQSNNAVVGINGELYNHAGRNNILIRQGTMYRDTPQNSQTLFIDSNGDFVIRNAREAVAEGILDNPDNKIYQTVSFGPALVADGELLSRKDDDTHFSYRNPRSAIGQTGPLEYLLVSVEGRSDESKGLNTNHMAMLMHDLGCIQAYNLDGGQSSEIVFNGKPYNNISNSGERQFSDLLYFGTAMPEE